VARFRNIKNLMTNNSLTIGGGNQRPFPPPWSVEELDACYLVRDHNGQQLAYVYFEDELGRRSKSTRPSTVTLGTEH
jgi:hypothetical protein